MKISELPQEIMAKALHYQRKEKNMVFYKTSDVLSSSFDWNTTEEGVNYWSVLERSNTIEDAQKIHDNLNLVYGILKDDKNNTYKKPKHYDNSKGSLYQFCEAQALNTYEFDIIKRVMRCRKKGNFLEDLEKTKFLIDLYIKEHTEKIDFPHRQS